MNRDSRTLYILAASALWRVNMGEADVERPAVERLAKAEKRSVSMMVLQLVNEALVARGEIRPPKRKVQP